MLVSDYTEDLKPKPSPDMPHEACPICGQPFMFERNTGFLSNVRPWLKTYDGHQDCMDELRKIEDEQREIQRATWEAEQKERERKERIEKLLLCSGMPPELVTSRNFDSFDVSPENKRAFDILDSWTETDKWGVMLQGGVGTGKTHLMLAFANRWIHNLVSVEFRSVTDIFDLLRSGYNNDNYHHVMQALRARPILILDDIGAEKPGDWVEEKLFQILDHRVNHSMPTFFTTNCTPSELKSRLHERITSRIKELAVIVPLSGKDRRNEKYEQRLIEIERRLRSKE